MMRHTNAQVVLSKNQRPKQMKLSTLIHDRKKQLKQANPRSRDRIRNRLRVLEVVKLLRKKSA